MTLRQLKSLVTGASNVCELYIAIVAELWERSALDVRKLLGPSRYAWDVDGAMLRAEEHLRSLKQPGTREIVADGFTPYQTALRNLIDAVWPYDRGHFPVALALRLLYRLDSIAGEDLRSRECCTYPDPPSNGYTIVARRPRPYYAHEGMDRPLSALRDSGSLRAAFSEILRTTYVIPPPGGEASVTWRIRRLPHVVEAQLVEQHTRRVLLLALPHDAEILDCSVDAAHCSFTVHGLEPRAEERLVEDVRTLLDEELRRHRWSVVVLPEYTATPAIRACVRDVLRRFPNRVGFVVPGSTREDVGRRRLNRCRCVGPDGSEGQHLPEHAKLSRFQLTPSNAPARYREELAGCNGNVTEAIEVEEGEPHVTFWDSATLGRMVILICKDLLDPSVSPFLRMHYVDHIFVPAMSPTLEDFEREGVDLAMVMGAGLYVANAPLWTHKRTGGRHAALAYRPVRGGHLGTLKECAETHTVCAHGFDLRQGWI